MLSWLGGGMRRRDFFGWLAATSAAMPVAAYAQQPAMPVVGFLSPASPDTSADRLRGFHGGLKETGFIEGENVAVVYRWGESQSDRLPELVADLVHRQVAVIATGGHLAAFAAKAATTTIPTLFMFGDDPVQLGLVTSLSRPSGNLTEEVQRDSEKLTPAEHCALLFCVGV
jgi:putative tryptophan/tyrosine transport system substrate-binding protein